MTLTVKEGEVGRLVARTEAARTSDTCTSSVIVGRILLSEVYSTCLGDFSMAHVSGVDYILVRVIQFCFRFQFGSPIYINCTCSLATATTFWT